MNLVASQVKEVTVEGMLKLKLFTSPSDFVGDKVTGSNLKPKDSVNISLAIDQAETQSSQLDMMRAEAYFNLAVIYKRQTWHTKSL